MADCRIFQSLWKGFHGSSVKRTIRHCVEQFCSYSPFLQIVIFFSFHHQQSFLLPYFSSSICALCWSAQTPFLIIFESCIRATHWNQNCARFFFVFFTAISTVGLQWMQQRIFNGLSNIHLMICWELAVMKCFPWPNTICLDQPVVCVHSEASPMSWIRDVGSLWTPT